MLGQQPGSAPRAPHRVRIGTFCKPVASACRLFRVQRSTSVTRRARMKNLLRALERRPCPEKRVENRMRPEFYDRNYKGELPRE